MLNDTLTAGLKPYAIGDKLRALRLKSKMGLVELGKHTTLSPGLLSRIERGKMVPTLPTLLRIAMVFSVGLEYFFSAEREKKILAIVRKRDRLRFPAQPDADQPSYFFENLDFPILQPKLKAYLADFRKVPSEQARSHQHAGIEFLYVISGKLAVSLGESEYVLAAGDAIYFQSDTPHSYRNKGSAECTGIIVTTV